MDDGYEKIWNKVLQDDSKDNDYKIRQLKDIQEMKQRDTESETQQLTAKWDAIIKLLKQWLRTLWPWILFLLACWLILININRTDSSALSLAQGLIDRLPDFSWFLSNK